MDKPYKRIFNSHWFRPHDWVLLEEGHVYEFGVARGIYRTFECLKCGKIKTKKNKIAGDFQQLGR